MNVGGLESVVGSGRDGPEDGRKQLFAREDLTDRCG
jgi:hypothetical protein